MGGHGGLKPTLRELDQPRADDGARRVRACKEIIRVVEDGIEREAAEGAVDCLHGEMLERQPG